VARRSLQHVVHVADRAAGASIVQTNLTLLLLIVLSANIIEAMEIGDRPLAHGGGFGGEFSQSGDVTTVGLMLSLWLSQGSNGDET